MSAEQLEYMGNRRKNARPQGVLLSNNPGYIEDGKRIPDGVEFEDFIILTDDNRAPISLEFNRLERKERTINGRMRSYHIADKLNINLAWDMVPSRAFATDPTIRSVIQSNPGTITSPSKSEQYTSDNGAGGVDILDWYETYTGSFWIFLSYDKYTNLNGERDRLQEYSEVIEVFCSGFDYSIERRGGSTHDFWTINMSLEEV